MTEPPSECPRCGTGWGRAMLACPGCGRLIWSDALKELAAAAQEAESARDFERAAGAWRNALMLLPAGAGQRATIEATIARLTSEQAAGAGEHEEVRRKSRSWAKWLGVAAPVAAFLVTKGKFVVLGLTKLPTLFSMLLFLSVYWERWGWAFALGFVLSIYIHEMGHVIALKHYGIPASAPLFIPGLGAVIFARSHIGSPEQDARVGLAGPAAGLCAALFCLALYPLTSNPLFLALAVFGAYINLFNLIPILFLDGSRGARGLDRGQRWIVTGVAAACWLAFESQLSLAVALVMAGRQWFWKAAETNSRADRLSFATFVVLLIALAAVANVPAPTPEELRPGGKAPGAERAVADPTRSTVPSLRAVAARGPSR